MSFRSPVHVIQLILLIGRCISQNCVYTNATTGYKLYLNALEHATLTYQNTDGGSHFYTFTPCRNSAVECDNDNGGKDVSMCS